MPYTEMAEKSDGILQKNSRKMLKDRIQQFTDYSSFNEVGETKGILIK